MDLSNLYACARSCDHVVTAIVTEQKAMENMGDPGYNYYRISPAEVSAICKDNHRVKIFR